MAIESAETVDLTAANALELVATPAQPSVGSPRPVRSRLEWIRVENLDAAEAFVSFYDARAADVTAGTDRFGDPIRIPASAAPEVIPVDLQFRGELTILVSTGQDGTGAPTTGCRIDASWKREA